MNKKSYWCPKCGRMFMGAAAFKKHVDSKKCKLNVEKDVKKQMNVPIYICPVDEELEYTKE